VIISFQTNASGIETEGEKLAKFVVDEDATMSKEEEFSSSMETELNQHIEVRQRVQRATLQAWNEAERMLGWFYILFVSITGKFSLEILSNNVVKLIRFPQGRKEKNYSGIQDVAAIVQQHGKVDDHQQNYVWDPRGC